MKQLKNIQNLSKFFELLVNESDGERFVNNKKNNLIIKVKENGYIPKTGLLLVEYLYESDITGNYAIDIGTGETGIIAQSLYAEKRFTNIYAVDIDNNAIRHAKTSSSIADKIIWKNSNCFDSIDKSIKFDLIISNPPQMPVKENASLHDDGGTDGLDIIKIILQNGINYLTQNGKIIIQCFDFLVDSGKIEEIAKLSNLKYQTKKKIRRNIRPNGKTLENMKWITKEYPNFKLKYSKQSMPYHFIKILEFVFM